MIMLTGCHVPNTNHSCLEAIFLPLGIFEEELKIISFAQFQLD